MAIDLKYVREIYGLRYRLYIRDIIRLKDKDEA